jgi:hypothetical protein
LKPKKTDIDRHLKKLDDYSSRENVNGVSSKLSNNADPLMRGNGTNYKVPRGRDLLYNYNTQYGGGFGNFKNTKFAQYHQAYTRIDDKKKISKKKQTASSLQRIEQSHQFSQIPKYNKITTNFSKNEFSSSLYNVDSSNTCLGK